MEIYFIPFSTAHKHSTVIGHYICGRGIGEPMGDETVAQGTAQGTNYFCYSLSRLVPVLGTWTCIWYFCMYIFDTSMVYLKSITISPNL